MKYFARANENEFTVEIEQSGEGRVVEIEGQPVEAELQPISDNLYSLLIGGRSHQLYAERRDGVYHVTLNGRQHAIRVEDEKKRFVRKLIKLEAKQEGEIEIKAPMPGLILSVSVKEGQSVAAGDSLLVVEAMKMENELRAEAAGVVKKIFHKDGASVEKDAVLLLLDTTGTS